MSQRKPEDPFQHHATQFAVAIRKYASTLPMTVTNVEDVKELIRVSGNIGARYIQALYGNNKVAYINGLKTCNADTLTTIHWLNLLDTQGSRDLDHRRQQLVQAAEELSRVLKQLIQNENR